MIKNIYEFILWSNCNNNCKFCNQRDYFKEIDVKKYSSNVLHSTLDFLSSNKYENGSHILLVGGELFDKPHIFNNLKKFFIVLVTNYMVTNKIGLLYLNTNLLYKDLSMIKFVLELLQSFNLLHRLKFTTSYDIRGRFVNDNMKMLMISNLKEIKQYDINVVVNMILTKSMCEAILNRDFCVKSFMDDFNCDVNLIPYIKLNEYNDIADKNMIYDVLKCVDVQLNGKYLERYIKNFDLKQDKLLYMYDINTNKFDFCSCENLECGHSNNFKLYSEDSTCFICDLKERFFYGKQK